MAIRSGLPFLSIFAVLASSLAALLPDTVFSVTAAATTWDGLRDWILWPLLYTFAPDLVRRAIARRIMRGDRYFREETQALRANISDFLPEADLQHAQRCCPIA